MMVFSLIVIHGSQQRPLAAQIITLFLLRLQSKVNRSHDPLDTFTRDS